MPLRPRRGPRARDLLPEGATYCRRCRSSWATILGRWCSSCAERIADERVARYVRRRDGACVACGSTRQLTWAHILPRRYRRLRWDPRNAVTLCWPDHDWLDRHPARKREWVRERFPGLLERLEELKDMAPLPDLEEIIRTYGGAS